MKRVVKLFLFVALFAAIAMSAQAGSYFKQNHSLYLDGKVHIRFDHLLLAWSHDGKIDRIRYEMTCLAGKAVLDKVEYLDKAVEGKLMSRWTQSEQPLNLDFSAKFSHLDKHHRVQISKTNFTSITPFDPASGKVCFHIKASDRNYKVFWAPKTGEVYAIW